MPGGCLGYDKTPCHGDNTGFYQLEPDIVSGLGRVSAAGGGGVFYFIIRGVFGLQKFYADSGGGSITFPDKGRPAGRLDEGSGRVRGLETGEAYSDDCSGQ